MTTQETAPHKENYFFFEGKQLPLQFIETMQVKMGVVCDVYAFKNDAEKDLGIIRISPACKTPLQKVLQGDKTIEGYISGKGKLVITSISETNEEYKVNDNESKGFSITVKKGEIMQWIAEPDSELHVYEICFPPYKDGRYENLSE
jgi:hypothetical protein